MMKTSLIIQKLKTEGHRLTRTRKSIIDIFIKTGRPVSAIELQSLLKKGGVNVNKTTVYREVDFLKQHKIIREIQLGDGKRRYEIWPDNHHHHLVCVQCERIECIEFERCMESEEKKISAERNFKILDHSLKFFGICAKCQ